MKRAHLTVTRTLTLAEVMMKTLLSQVKAKFIFDQGHRTLGILMVSILSLEILVE